MEFELWSTPGTDDPLDLDHERFPYAGKFGRRSTGTAIAREVDTVVAAVAFSPDRVNESRCRIRYIAVARDRQGEGIASRLIEWFVQWARSTGYATVRINVLNPYAVTALARSGFGYTASSGPRGGVILEYPDPRHTDIVDAYRDLPVTSLTEEQRDYARQVIVGREVTEFDDS